MSNLKNVTDPEEKRKLIGNTFISVFESFTKDNDDIKFLAQGTLYPDVIESATNDSPNAAKIKTHHNVGGLPDEMNFDLVEPLRNLFKDEVRIIGRELDLPDFLIDRQPFPGPGLAIRIMGEINSDKLELLREADWILMDEIKNHDLYKDLWQSFAVLLNTQTVGVMGDHRTYEYTIAIRAVKSEDAKIDAITIVAINSIKVNPFENLFIIKNADKYRRFIIKFLNLINYPPGHKQ